MSLWGSPCPRGQRPTAARTPPSVTSGPGSLDTKPQLLLSHPDRTVKANPTSPLSSTRLPPPVSPSHSENEAKQARTALSDGVRAQLSHSAAQGVIHTHPSSPGKQVLGSPNTCPTLRSPSRGRGRGCVKGGSPALSSMPSPDNGGHGSHVPSPCGPGRVLKSG